MFQRDDYISWNQYFMSIAIVSAMRSKDPSTQVGACVVDSENNILSLGYNGAPRGFSDDDFNWGKGDPDVTKNKYPYVCHAELNAILNAARKGTSLCGATLYVTLYPCNECAKAIVQAGIKKVIYLDDKDHDKPLTGVSRKILAKTQVKVEKFNREDKEIKFKI